MKIRITTGVMAPFLLVSHPLSALPLNGVFLEVGHSQSSHSDLALSRMSLQKEIKGAHFGGGSWQIRGYWDFSVGHWKNASLARTSSGMTDVGLTPLFRFERECQSSVLPYLEAGV